MDLIRSAVAIRATSSVSGLIYVLLPVHQRRDVSRRFVESLREQTDQHFQLILIDDGSTDGTEEAVTAVIPDPVVIRGRGDWWWGGSLQQGYLWLRAQATGPGDIVLIANDDTMPEPDFLAEGREALERNPYSLVLPGLYGADGALEEVGAHIDWARLRFTGVLDPNEVNCLSTRGLFLRLDDFLRVGGFHPRLLPHYLSDYEFSLRAARRGMTLRPEPSLRLSYDPTLTGIRSGPGRGPRSFLRRVFTKKDAGNPVYLTTFVLLASPRRYLVQDLALVWLRFVRALARAAGA